MKIPIHPELETKLRARAPAEGLTVEAYLERLVHVDLSIEDQLETLAIEGINSGDPIEPGTAYWHDKHRRLDEKAKAIK